MELSHVSIRLSTLSVYRDLLVQPVIQTVLQLAHALDHRDGPTALSLYSQLFYTLQQEGCTSLGQWLYQALRWSEAPYPTTLVHGSCPRNLAQAAMVDVTVLRELAQIPCDTWLDAISNCLSPQLRPMLHTMPRWLVEVPFTFADLSQSYNQEGTGLLARYNAFVWEKDSLIPVHHPDCPTRDQLVGYEEQRSQLIENTQALIAGRQVNHVLLYGESGTGKSATVKHLLTLPGMEQLRIVALHTEDLSTLPILLRTLVESPLKFIIFIHDLTCEPHISTDSTLRTCLVGGIQSLPKNVAIYATSNHPNLVQEIYGQQGDDTADQNGFIHKLFPLVDGFGIRIQYQGLNQETFLALVDRLAQIHGCPLPPEQLHQQAMTWGRQHGSTTPRTALQFIHSL